ncbi:MAG: hypothetical protein JRI23_09780 [Deltaproteobacteria bacterium]|jgi:hypothetical protein|nr:hypothetical protein [Deltaproteobacteria bacterium]MBW2531957.1 hypothetical protein [Deltaproteobacteria bacterium]
MCLLFSSTTTGCLEPDSQASEQSHTETTSAPQGTYEGRAGALFTVQSIFARLQLPDGSEYSGDLHPVEGSNAEYIIGQLYEADYRCGTFAVAMSGFEGDTEDGSALYLTWLPPEGPVPPDCTFMQAGEGLFTRTADEEPTCERRYYPNENAGEDAAARGWLNQTIVQLDDRARRIDLLNAHEQIAVTFEKGTSWYYAWAYTNDYEPPRPLAEQWLSEEHRERILTLAREAETSGQPFELQVGVTGVLLGYYSLSCDAE